MQYIFDPNLTFYEGIVRIINFFRHDNYHINDIGFSINSEKSIITYNYTTDQYKYLYYIQYIENNIFLNANINIHLLSDSFKTIYIIKNSYIKSTYIHHFFNNELLIQLFIKNYKKKLSVLNKQLSWHGINVNINEELIQGFINKVQASILLLEL